MLPSSLERVMKNTTEEANEEIRRRMKSSIAYYSLADRHDIDKRLEELEHEWDIERVLETNAAGLGLLGLVLGMMKKRFLLLTLFTSGFLLQHGLQGWCPPLPILRRLGFRTQAEIDYERYALKYLRGDFENLPEGEGPLDEIEQIVEAARR